MIMIVMSSASPELQKMEIMIMLIISSFSLTSVLQEPRTALLPIQLG